MKAAARASYRAACLFGLAALPGLLSPRAAAQSVPEAGGDYQDHYIAGGQLPPDISLGDYTSSDPGQLARALRVDGVLSTLSEQGPGAAPRVHEDGVLLDAQWDTAAYGAWSALGGARLSGADLRAGAAGTARTSFTLRERGMPFDDGWQSDNGLGDLNSPLIAVARAQPRFLLVSSPFQGLMTEWRGPSQLQIVAGGGEPGVFQGLAVPGFQTLGGSTATFGAAFSPAPQWTLGAQAITSRDVNLDLGLLDGGAVNAIPSLFSSTTGYMTAAWQQGSTHAQFNLVDGSINGSNSNVGAWLDASTRQGFFTHSGGLFYIEPNLAWGSQLMASDIEGGYYRMNYQSRRWLFDAGVDEALSVSGKGTNVTFLTGDTRYQLTHDAGVGGAANLSLSS
ncbi:MAG: hypothetical protein JO341_10390, partial [Gammaproteobacteria bacterium]|nr:hypothetical protein [Gammaproteobacteria bacterium]